MKLVPSSSNRSRVISEMDRIVETAKFDRFESGYKQTNFHQLERPSISEKNQVTVSPGGLLKETPNKPGPHLGDTWSRKKSRAPDPYQYCQPEDIATLRKAREITLQR